MAGTYPPGRTGRTARSGGEDPALLQLELGLVEDPGVTELSQLTQLGQFRAGVGAGRGRRLVLRGLLDAPGALRGPPTCLTAGDAVGDGGGRAGDDSKIGRAHV